MVLLSLTIDGLINQYINRLSIPIQIVRSNNTLWVLSFPGLKSCIAINWFSELTGLFLLVLILCWWLFVQNLIVLPTVIPIILSQYKQRSKCTKCFWDWKHNPSALIKSLKNKISFNWDTVSNFCVMTETPQVTKTPNSLEMYWSHDLTVLNWTKLRCYHAHGRDAKNKKVSEAAFLKTSPIATETAFVYEAKTMNTFCPPSLFSWPVKNSQCWHASSLL